MYIEYPFVFIVLGASVLIGWTQNHAWRIGRTFGNKYRSCTFWWCLPSF